MTETDVIFKFYTSEELSEVESSDFSYFGWEGKNEFAFFSFAEGYKYSADAIFEKFINSAGNFAIIDTLVYPLCYAFRHCMEMQIKYLYVKYSGATEEDLKLFLNSNHNLNESWKKVKPILTAGKKKVGSRINIGALEHYIQEMTRFDPISMRMRYPVDKRLEKHNSQIFRLDVPDFYKKMTAFYHAMRQIDYDIDNQIESQASEEDIRAFIDMYHSVEPSILSFLKSIQVFVSERESFEIVSFDNIYDIFNEHGEGNTINHRWESLPSNAQIIVEALYYAASSVNSNSARLSQAPKDKLADFVTLCIDHMETHGLEFEEDVVEGDLNVHSKTASSIVNNLNTAIDLLSLS